MWFFAEVLETVSWFEERISVSYQEVSLWARKELKQNNLGDFQSVTRAAKGLSLCPWDEELSLTLALSQYSPCRFVFD